MSEPILSISGLKKNFHKDHLEIKVLKNINLEVQQNDFVTIMGPSGAGKSTFLHILGTLDAPTEGDIHFRGQNLKAFTEDEVNKFRNEKIGFVFQFYHLLQDFNVIENITLPLLVKRMSITDAVQKAENFLEIMGLKERRSHKPGELSGGEQQRVAIARALVNGPEIILADEPTGNLDRKTGREVLDYILAVNKQLSSTLILVTHDPEIGALGSRRFRMVDGELFQSESR